METEREVLTRQIVAGLASLAELGHRVPSAGRAAAREDLARLSADELAALAASLAILIDGARGLDAGSEDGNTG